MQIIWLILMILAMAQIIGSLVAMKEILWEEELLSNEIMKVKDIILPLLCMAIFLSVWLFLSLLSSFFTL